MHSCESSELTFVADFDMLQVIRLRSAVLGSQIGPFGRTFGVQLFCRERTSQHHPYSCGV